MIEYLSLNRYVSVTEMRNVFHISRATVLRDVEILSCSVPIYTVRGKGGGIRVADGWYLSKTYLRDEQEQLLRNLLPNLSEKDQQTMNGILQMFAKPKVEA